MPRLRHHWGGSTSSAAIVAIARAEDEAAEESSEDESDDEATAVDIYGILRELLEVKILLGAQAQSKARKSGSVAKSKPVKRVASRNDAGGGNSKHPSDSMARISDEETVEELGEFIEFLADELYNSLPSDLRHFDRKIGDIVDVSGEDYCELLVSRASVSVTDSLLAYGLLSTNSEGNSANFLRDLYGDFLNSLANARRDASAPDDAPCKIVACQLCERSCIPLTAHHLIPRQVHAKAVKRGWVKDLEECQRRVAWMCRACHSFVHRLAKNEELARRWNTIEALESREDVGRWVDWVRKVRWKKR